MASPKPEHLAILIAAIDSPFGLVLRTSDSAKARAVLYAARAASGDPRFARLQIRSSPFAEGDLVLAIGQEPRLRQTLAALDLDL